MKKLRLLVTDKCNRACPGCCNKGYDLAALPVLDTYLGWDEVNITGGEPMLDPDATMGVISLFPWTRVFVYTAKVDDLQATLDVLELADGMTLTLHTQEDVAPFLVLNKALDTELCDEQLSLRLNVFEGVKIPEEVNIDKWKVKAHMAWIKDCPLPKDEVFMRL